MAREKQDQYYPGFDDADDFLPDEDELRGEPRGSDRDSREWTGGHKLRTLPRVLLGLLIILAVAVILNYTVFRVYHVRVIGNQTYTSAAVAAQAGLDKSTGFFTVNVDKVRENLEKDPYLAFVDLRRQFPNTLVLFIKERMPCANVQGGGNVYLVDEDAYVLKTLNPARERNSLPMVMGMQVSEAKAGSRIVSYKPGKVDEYCELMQELLLQGVVNDFDQINLTDSEHVYLRHVDGYVAELGTLKELMAKIGTLRAVVSALQESGLRNGYIDVTIPGEAIYSPE